MSRFSGKTVIVTGGGSGIGQAAVRRFASEGANVLAADQSEDGLAETLSGLDTSRVITRIVDVSRQDEVEGMVQAAVDRFGQLEPVALVCADGYTWNGTAHDRVAASEELRAALPSVRLGVMVRRSGRDSSPAGDPPAPGRP